ncbi:MAG: hypothetical protein QOD56_316, partial [Gammaproteobacteria bacterium]|nr:hypothetical protein [Gammaproteobacteria bacterium]
MIRVVAAALLSVVLLQSANASDSFSLTATQNNFKNYCPTYLANGYWSVASSLQGTTPTLALIAGVMDYTSDDVSRPAAIPSWNEIDYFDGSEWLNSATVEPDTHSRYHQTLDMRDGLLRTGYRWRSHAHVSDVAVTLFVSQSASHLAAVSLNVTPHFTGTVRLRFTLRAPPAPQRLPLAQMTAEQFNAAATAANRPELAVGGNRSAIWYPGQVAVGAMGSDVPTRSLWMDGKAIGGRTVGLAAAVDLPKDLHVLGANASQTPDAVTLEIRARVHSGHRYRFTKFVAAGADGWDITAPASPGPNAAIDARNQGLAALQAAHVAAWHGLWRTDIRLGGSADLQRTLHSDLFYLLENSTHDTGWPAAAGGFSTLYFGHVFWDSDFWVFPTLLLLHPDRAKSLVTFRENTLPQALARAKAHGFEGAMYPWEADPWTGEDVTPKFAIENADREIHVNGAVALAQWQYYLASGDRVWLRDKGFPVMKAVADFWVSRMTHDSAAKRFELLDVTSPEEDYTHVDNEIYTNIAAHRSLEAALVAARELGLTPDPRWREAADAMYLPTAGTGGAYVEFDPKTPHDKTTSWMATSVPMLSIPALGFSADPSTLEGLFRHSAAAVGSMRDRANQMVLVMLAIQAASVGDADYFSELIGASGHADDPFLKPPFNVRSETPQNNSVYLLATSGGFLQSFIFGLSGLRIEEHGLVERFPPTLPKELTYLEL